MNAKVFNKVHIRKVFVKFSSLSFTKRDNEAFVRICFLYLVLYAGYEDGDYAEILKYSFSDFVKMIYISVTIFLKIQIRMNLTDISSTVLQNILQFRERIAINQNQLQLYHSCRLLLAIYFK